MENSPTGSGDGYFEFEAPVALWNLVENCVPKHERQEIRKMLGESLVEQSLDLQQEVNTLLEIWREYREETEEIFTRNRIPEPPAVRERLKQEIKFFVESIREKAKENGSNADVVLEKHKTDVIDYALDTERAPSSGYYSRPSTARSSKDGRDTPLRRGTPLPDRDSNVCSRSEEVEAMNDKLTYLKFDEVVQHLRETLEEEVAQLTRDSEFLQSCLDDEADFRCLTGPNREPTLTELREERSQLEKELLQPSMPKLRPRPQQIKSIQQRPLAKPPSPSKSFHRQNLPDTKPKPLKACHNVAIDLNNTISKSQKTLPNSEVKKVNKSFKMQTSVASSSRNRDIISDCDYEAQHIVVRTNVMSKPPARASSENTRDHIPCPPKTAKPVSRPGTAQKFRKMIMECRE